MSSGFQFPVALGRGSKDLFNCYFSGEIITANQMANKSRHAKNLLMLHVLSPNASGTLQHGTVQRSDKRPEDLY